MNSYLERYGAELDAAAARLAAGERRRDRRPLTLAAAVGACLVLIAVVIAVARPQEASELEAGPASSTLKDSFAVLRRPGTPADAMPERWRDMLVRGFDSEAPQFDQARAAQFGDATVWVVPTATGACVVVADGDVFGAGCNPDASFLAAEGTFGISGGAPSLPNGHVRVYGILPDGATDPQVRLPDGPHPVEVKGNLYSAVAPGGDPGFVWTDAQGQQHGTSTAEAATPEPQTPGGMTMQPPVAAVSRDLRESFSVFANPPTPIRGMAARTPAGQNFNEARTVGPDTYADMYVIPASDGLCSRVAERPSSFGSSCNTLEDAVNRGMLSSSGAPGQSKDRVVFGIVPDWVEEVVMEAPDGQRLTAAVIRNAFQIRVPPRTRAGQFIGPDGGATPINVPNP